MSIGRRILWTIKIYFVGDHSVRIWDRRTAYPQVVIAAHNAEVLTCDWSKYDQVLEFFSLSGATIGLSNLCEAEVFAQINSDENSILQYLHFYCNRLR